MLSRLFDASLDYPISLEDVANLVESPNGGLSVRMNMLRFGFNIFDKNQQTSSIASTST